jgi:hypothetical protein
MRQTAMMQPEAARLQDGHGHDARVQAPRAKRFFFDPRFAIGVALVAASVGGVYALVTVSNTTTEVYAARSTLTAGDVIDVSDLAVVGVELGSRRENYIAQGAAPHGELVVTRTIEAGELVPASALTTQARSRLTSVMLTVRAPLPADVRSGAAVDVWSAKAVEHEGFEPPAVLVSGARVARVVADDGLVSDRQNVSVEVRVPESKTAALLAAVQADDAISLVPAGGGAR